MPVKIAGGPIVTIQYKANGKSSNKPKAPSSKGGGDNDELAKLASELGRAAGEGQKGNLAEQMARNAAGEHAPASSTGKTFVTTSRGRTYDIPEGWVGRTANNGKGVVYQRPGATGNADMIRIMEPTPKYPNGYARVYNSQGKGQPVDVFGKPGPPATTRIPEDYVGPWPGWPGQ